MVYKWYILPIGWLYITYHLLGEPETTIETCWVSYCTIDYNLLLSGSPICKHTHTAWVYLVPVGKGWEQGGWLNGHGAMENIPFICSALSWWMQDFSKYEGLHVWRMVIYSKIKYVLPFHMHSLKLTWPVKIGPPKKKSSSNQWFSSAMFLFQGEYVS